MQANTQNTNDNTNNNNNDNTNDTNNTVTNDTKNETTTGYATPTVVPDVPLKDLSERYHVDGCNIEGNDVGQAYIKANRDVIWANLCTPLDFPVTLPTKTHSKITKKPLANISAITEEHEQQLEEQRKKFGDNLPTGVDPIGPLKEFIIDEFDVKGYFVNILMVLTWYIDNAARLTNRSDPKIVVQTHRGSSGKIQNKIIQDYLVKYYGCSHDNLQFTIGYKPNTLVAVEDADIHVSVSLIMGLNPSSNSGDIFIPTTWYKMDTDNNKVYLDGPLNPSVENNLSLHASAIFSDEERYRKCCDAVGLEGPNKSTVHYDGTICQITKIYEPLVTDKVEVMHPPTAVQADFLVKDWNGYGWLVDTRRWDNNDKLIKDGLIMRCFDENNIEEAVNKLSKLAPKCTMTIEANKCADIWRKIATKFGITIQN